MVSRATHQGRAVFLVAFLSRGSPVTCFPMAWCWVESHSLPTSTSHLCPLVEPLLVFAFWGLKSSSVVKVVEASIPSITSANFRGAEQRLYAAVFHRARIMGAVSFRFFFETASAEGLLTSSVSLLLFRDLTPLLGGGATIITDSTSLSWSGLSNSCLPLLEL